MNKHIAILLAFVLLVLSADALADTHLWQVTTGNWNVAGSWNLGIPASGDDVKINNSGGKCTVPSGYTASPYKCFVNHSGTNSLTVNGTLSAADLNIGYWTNGKGTLILNSGGSINASNFVVADGGGSWYKNADGKAYITGGIVNTGGLGVGNGASPGEYYQSGGSVKASSGVSVGKWGTGYFEISGGTLVSSYGFRIGPVGTAYLRKAAQIEINGSGPGFRVEPGGTLKIELGSSTDYTKLCNDADGISTTWGYIMAPSTLEVVLAGGYTPSVGDEWKLLAVTTTNRAIYGNFMTVTSGYKTELRNSNTELWLVRTNDSQPTPLRAFPSGAEGFGAYVSGGRGGDIYKVTNTNDSGTGSFRSALLKGSKPRTIIFTVGGTITCSSKIEQFGYTDITVAGQTAPGDGILLRNAGRFLLNGGSNYIFRHFRIRLGDSAAGTTDNCLMFDSTPGVMLDHVSTSWDVEETILFWNQCTYSTIQHCILAESLESGHQYANLISTSLKNAYFTNYGNLYHSQLGRMPRAQSKAGEGFLLDDVNNVRYNWGTSGDWPALCTNGIHVYAQTGNWNYVKNYCIAGPSSGALSYRQTILRAGGGTEYFWIDGNKCDYDIDGTLDGVDAGWTYVKGTYNKAASRHTRPTWATISNERTAADALTDVCNDAGARPWGRDAVDSRYITEVQSYGTSGSIKTSVPGWPTINSGTSPTDTDNDGMPDTWEDDYGTDDQVADNNGDLDSDGYTNLEEYLQWICDNDGALEP